MTLFAYGFLGAIVVAYVIALAVFSRMPRENRAALLIDACFLYMLFGLFFIAIGLGDIVTKCVTALTIVVVLVITAVMLRSVPRWREGDPSFENERYRDPDLNRR